MSAPAAHTPGPWRASPMAGDLSGQSRGIILFGQDGGPRIGTITVDDIEVGKANARLVVAAPNMLAALQDAKLALERLGTGGFIVHGMRVEDVIDAALASATTGSASSTDPGAANAGQTAASGPGSGGTEVS